LKKRGGERGVKEGEIFKTSEGERREFLPLRELRKPGGVLLWGIETAGRGGWKRRGEFKEKEGLSVKVLKESGKGRKGGKGQLGRGGGGKKELLFLMQKEGMGARLGRKGGTIMKKTRGIFYVIKGVSGGKGRLSRGRKNLRRRGEFG